MAVVANSLCFSLSARAACTKDLDCEGELICEEGSCVAAPPPSAQAPPLASPPSPSPAAPAAAAPPAPARSIREERPHFFDDAEAKPPRRVRRRFKQPGLFVVGIVTVSTGGVLAMYSLLGESCELGNCGSTETRSALLLGSLAAIGIGVPMIVIGARRENVPGVALAPWILPGRGGVQLQLRL